MGNLGTLGLISTATSTAMTDSTVLKLGAPGDSVKQIQVIILLKAGGDISITGVFDQQTEKRVKDLQQFFGLKDDGIVGEKTWVILDFVASE
jgi:peptidoglycan hydrolase-like protein with peptidoglycan-binding domain